MRKEIIKVYKFEELSNEAKEVARQWWKNGIDEDFSLYSSMITESFRQQLEELGYPTNDIEWRLSYSQGDGVAFYGEVNDDMMDKIVARMYENKSFLFMDIYQMLRRNDILITAKIFRNSYGHFYSHYNTMSIEIDGDSIETMMDYITDLDYEEDEKEYNEMYAKIESMLNDIKSFISSEIKDISRDFEKQGYEEIDYIYSDEAVDENIIGNEYEFTKDGKVW